MRKPTGASRENPNDFKQYEFSRRTAKAAGVHLGDYFKDVLLRISEPGTDVKDLTPHSWKERFEPEVTARRHEILQELLDQAT